MRGLCVLGVVLSVCATATAQQAPCEAAIPVNVMVPSGGLVRHIPPNGFLAQNKAATARIVSVTEDQGPRRILFIADDADLPAGTRKLESLIISTVVASARPEDSFALLTANGPRREVPFNADREAFKSTLGELEKPLKGVSQEKGVLDALFESSKIFQSSQPGDAIVLLSMTMGIDSAYGPAFGKVCAELAGRHIRVFGCLLGMLSEYYVPPGMAAGSSFFDMSLGRIWADSDNIFLLARDTGGFIFHETTNDDLREFKLTSEISKHIEYLSQQTYKAINEYYLVEVESPGKDMVIDLADSVKRQVPNATMVYPRLLADCPASGGVKTQ